MMGPGVGVALEIALRLMQQAQTYQLAVMKAQAEGRDLTNAELDDLRASANARNEALATQASGEAADL